MNAPLDKALSITFQLLAIGKPTANGRIYTQEVAEAIVQQVKAKPDRILCFPARTPVEEDVPPLHLACGVVRGAEIKDNAVVVRIRLVDTPTGKIMQDLLKAEGPSGWGVRNIGVGKVDEQGVVSDYIFTGTHLGPEEQLNEPNLPTPTE